jgi:hypothetical protein
LRRVEEAKKVMEAEMLQEMERRKQEQLEEAMRREVFLIFFCLSICLFATTAARPVRLRLHGQNVAATEKQFSLSLKDLTSIDPFD